MRLPLDKQVAHDLCGIALIRQLRTEGIALRRALCAEHLNFVALDTFLSASPGRGYPAAVGTPAAHRLLRAAIKAQRRLEHAARAVEAANAAVREVFAEAPTTGGGGEL